MKIVIGIDWSEQAFAAVREVFALYAPHEVVLVHGIDLSIFRHPVMAQAANLQGYEEFRRAMQDAGRQLIERTSALVPSDTPSVRKIYDFARPAAFLLDAARKVNPDLIAVGARGRGPVSELLLGSVSHRILMHSTCPTLIVKGEARPPKRVLVAVEGTEDAQRIRTWLINHPFRTPTELVVTTVIEQPHLTDPASIFVFDSWAESASQYAEDLVKTTAAALADHQYTVTTQILNGDPASVIAAQGEAFDLLVVGSHGRTGADRFLLGSVSHSITHRSIRPVLVVR